MRIMIVEDELSARQGLATLIQSLGGQYEIVSYASNGIEGLANLKKHLPDVAFVDICMPIMDGLTMIAEARKLSIPTAFIVISAHADFSYAREAMVNHTQDYLVKPFTVDDVRMALGRIVAPANSEQTYDAQHPAVKKVLDYIDRNYASPMNLQSVSSAMQITPEYLSYIFRRDTGQTFISYLRSYRIAKAAEIMREQNLKIFEIASAVGFSDAKYFCRVFRGIKKQSPSEYYKDVNKSRNIAQGQS